ncbi:hypothetical protein BIV25_13440 [Streptomyces sp. MUSC 14]|uniref:hypothetical protein n=1 Tax=Streptomyces sp. MUSC 14 TaxID=1354889 RepID=UPI0008F5E06E|nr:hypothetical protein [Streptomyces sp. MUSC 14]OIJ97804.1 hypothetical protein BIV25_13440 [Streptomyces sp. MUSC 14]
MPYPRGIQILADHIGVDPEHVALALRAASRSHAVIRANNFAHLTPEQYLNLTGSDRHAVAVVANLAMRFAGRIEDALLLMDIHHASQGTKAPRLAIREGVGTLPEHHDHAHVQQAIRILQAAGLPPIVTDGTHELRPGFQVLPGSSELPGWVFVAPDPECDDRRGFAGGQLGYLAVMRFAGWGVITEPMPHRLWAAVHPDYRNNPFTS